MPLYEFSCETCQWITAALKLDGTMPEFCSHCGEQMRMVVTVPQYWDYYKGGGRGQVSNDAHASESTPRP